MTDIVDRLRVYAEINDGSGLYTEAKCAYDAIDEIITLRVLVAAFYGQTQEKKDEEKKLGSPCTSPKDIPS